MTSHDITLLFSAIEHTTKRLEMQSLLAAAYANVSPEDAAILSYLVIGRVVPEFIPIEFQLADKTLRAVVEQQLGRSITEDLAKMGDVGTVWAACATQKGENLEVSELYKRLWEVALTKGAGSQVKKQQLIAALLKQLPPETGKYVLRIFNGKLRLGASERTILESLGKMDGANNVDKLKDLFGNTSDIGYTVYLYMKYKDKAFEKAAFVPGIPIAAKLVEREDSIEGIYKRIPQPIEEPKYDGLRIQIHVFQEKVLKEAFAERVWAPYYQSTLSTEENEKPMSLFGSPTASEDEYQVKLFSRSLEDMTDMFPEVVVAAKKIPAQYMKKFNEKVTALVLDGEVIGYNDIVKEYLPFAQTMTRKRKYEVDSAATSVPVKVFTFDILLVNNRNLMPEKLEERKKLLTFLDENTDVQQTIVKTPIHYPQSIEEATQLFQEYVAEGLEGVIFKDLSSTYTPGVRNFDWLKFKRAMKKELADTVDVVLVGYYYGEGKLSAFGIGALLAAVYDEKTDRYLTVTKIGTKVTHEQWQQIKVACDAVKTDRHLDSVIVPKVLTPDVWLVPTLVVEVEADEITKSPLHSSGYALRFPRFIRFREKKPEQATHVDELVQIKTKHAVKTNNGA